MNCYKAFVIFCLICLYLPWSAPDQIPTTGVCGCACVLYVKRCTWKRELSLCHWQYICIRWLYMYVHCTYVYVGVYVSSLDGSVKCTWYCTCTWPRCIHIHTWNSTAPKKFKLLAECGAWVYVCVRAHKCVCVRVYVHRGIHIHANTYTKTYVHMPNNSKWIPSSEYPLWVCGLIKSIRSRRQIVNTIFKTKPKSIYIYYICRYTHVYVYKLHDCFGQWYPL